MAENFNPVPEDIAAVYSDTLVKKSQQFDSALKLIKQAEKDVSKSSYPVRYHFPDRDGRLLDIYVTRKDIIMMKGAAFGMYHEMCYPVTESGDRWHDFLGHRTANDILKTNDIKPHEDTNGS